ncbi:MAG: DUF922 domain-containing protein [Acidobacteria bacterium]|nr:DUF922 domain-containing protein [Acidobacteriota bacterium]
MADTKEYYAVSGASAEELRWAMGRLGPIRDDGSRSDALTKWKFEYTYGREETPAGCRVSSLETDTTITTVLPRWTPGRSVPAALVRKWEDYVACVALHENGHRRIYLDAVARLRRRVEALGDFPRCADLDVALEALAENELRAVRGEQAGYEARTDHGYEQCGRFP